MASTALDLAADVLLMLMTQRLAGRKTRYIRALASAVCGAAAAGALRRLGMGRTGMLLAAIPLAYLLGGIACGQWRARNAALLLGACGLLGGTVTALQGAAGTRNAAWCVGAILAYALASCMLRARRAASDIRRVRLMIRRGGYEASIEAMVDSGNCLRDYLTHRPVIVLPQQARGALGLDGRALRPILAKTAGGRQMMDCFTPDQTVIAANGKRMQVEACAAFSPGLEAGTPALVPLALLTPEE